MGLMETVWGVKACGDIAMGDVGDEIDIIAMPEALEFAVAELDACERNPIPPVVPFAFETLPLLLLQLLSVVLFSTAVELDMEPSPLELSDDDDEPLMTGEAAAEFPDAVVDEPAIDPSPPDALRIFLTSMAYLSLHWRSLRSKFMPTEIVVH